MNSQDKSLDRQVERVVAFLNSRGVGFDTGTDHFSSGVAAAKFLTPMFGAAIQIPSRALGEMRRLRQALLELVAAGWKDQTAPDVLKDIASRSHYRIDFRSPHNAVFEPVISESVVSIVLRDVAALIEAGQWNRVKNCSNEACSSTFFDHSRNRTQRWHSFEVCGNKHNVAAYRARQT